MRLLISIPALNEADAIGEVIRSLPREVAGFDEVEVLVVDDGSTDDTAAVAEEAGASVVRHAHNRGVGGAFQSAVAEALRRGIDVLVTIDADGQFDPAEIPLLVEQVRSGADLATGNRFHASHRPEHMPLAKYWGNKGMTLLIRILSGIRLADVSCGFRAYGRDALLRLNLFGRFTYTQETILDLAHKGRRLAEVPIQVRYFPGRRSRVAGSLVRYAWNTSLIITRTVRDYHPFRFFGYAGILVFLAGLVLDLILLAWWWHSGQLTPYKVVGALGLALNTFGLVGVALGLVTDMLDRIRINQERLLYFEKRQFYDKPRELPPPRDP